MFSARWRKKWLVAHRWLGLSIGVLLAITGLTGSLLVFRSNIDEQLNPDIFHVAPSESRCSVDEVLATARASALAQTGEISFVDLPRSENGVWTVWFQTGTKQAPQLTKLYLDPFQAKVTGQRVHGHDLMTWIYKLHVDLFVGEAGKTLVGFAGILLMVSILSGVILWWPLWKNSWRAAFAIRPGGRLNYDVHKTSGIVLSVPMLVLAFSGVYLTFPTWIAPCIQTLFADSSSPTPRRRPRSAPEKAEVRISAGQALAAVQARFPDAQLRRIHPPAAPTGAYIVRFCEPGDVHHSLGSSRAWVDPSRGEILRVNELSQKSTADSIISWQLPLHNGEAFGLPGRWAAFWTGLALPLLFLTGFYLWRRRHRPRAR